MGRGETDGSGRIRAGRIRRRGRRSGRVCWRYAGGNAGDADGFAEGDDDDAQGGGRRGSGLREHSQRRRCGQEVGRRRGAANALVFSRSAVHQSGDHHRWERGSQYHHSAGRFHYDVAHGDDGFDAAGGVGQRDGQHQSVSGFLHGRGPAGDADAGRPGFDSGGGLQLLGGQGRGGSAIAAGGLVRAGAGYGR